MSVIHGNYNNQNILPVLVDSQGRPLVVIDSVTGTYLQVDVHSLPSIPAGNNNIGDVDVVSLPSNVLAGMTSLPAGSNVIGKVDINSPVPLRVMGKQSEAIFALESVIVAHKENTNLGAGYINLSFDTVPSGKVDIITCTSVAYGGTNPGTIIWLMVITPTVSAVMKQIVAPTNGLYYNIDATMYVPESSYVNVRIGGHTVGDDLYANIIGYRMNKP
jgi:hypothetical protein